MCFEIFSNLKCERSWKENICEKSVAGSHEGGELSVRTSALSWGSVNTRCCTLNSHCETSKGLEVERWETLAMLQRLGPVCNFDHNNHCSYSHNKMRDKFNLKSSTPISWPISQNTKPASVFQPIAAILIMKI